MNDSNEQKPAGYGHDKKGAAGGAAKNEGRVHVAHKAPMQGVPDLGDKPAAETFTIDDREVDIREGETIFRAARRLGVKPGDPIRVSTRRGVVELAARQDDAIADGVVFIPFAFVEAAANLLTNPALDPFGKIPEFKYCAARVEAVDPAAKVAAE